MQGGGGGRNDLVSTLCTYILILMHALLEFRYSHIRVTDPYTYVYLIFSADVAQFTIKFP